MLSSSWFFMPMYFKIFEMFPVAGGGKSRESLVFKRLSSVILSELIWAFNLARLISDRIHSQNNLILSSFK